MINQRLLVVIIAMISFCGCKNDKLAVSEIGLNDNWSFQKVGDTVWLDTKVPGSVHIDLLNNKKIKDPFLTVNAGSNAMNYQIKDIAKNSYSPLGSLLIKFIFNT